MFKLLFRHKALYIITVAAAVLATYLLYGFLQAQPNHRVLTVSFVDAMAMGSNDRIAKTFAPDARSTYLTRDNTDIFASPGQNAAGALEGALLRDSADIVILDQLNLKMLAAQGMLEPIESGSMLAQESELVSLEGQCYGIVLDGLDITGKGDVLLGYKGAKPEQQQYFCAAVLAKSNNKADALQSLLKLRNIIAAIPTPTPRNTTGSVCNTNALAFRISTA